MVNATNDDDESNFFNKSHRDYNFRRARFMRNITRARRARRKKLMNHYYLDPTETHKEFMNQSKQDVFVGASDIGDYFACSTAMARNERKMDTRVCYLTILADRKAWMQTIKQCGLRHFIVADDRGFLIDDKLLSYFSFDINASSIIVKLHGDQQFIDKWADQLSSEYEVVENVVEWIYSANGESIEIPLRADRVPIDEMYPWLGEERLTDYYDRFMDSDASILLLIGPPGTGKTTFIRGLLQHTKQSALVTYDSALLEKDYVFASFVEGDRSIMVLEDADNFLGTRSEGNNMMHKFLNVGDGLVSTKNKKMIFSTNLPSVQDIDPALIRPGRCFDIVNFSLFNQHQADLLVKKLGVEIQSKPNTLYSLADIFFNQTATVKVARPKIGFA